MTDSGEKPEDYREITKYWLVRLFDFNGVELYPDDIEEILYELNNKNYSVSDLFKWIGIKPNRFDITHLYNGGSPCLKYPNFEIEHLGIEIREGNPKWGAVPGKRYFVIKHGKKINNTPLIDLQKGESWP